MRGEDWPSVLVSVLPDPLRLPIKTRPKQVSVVK